MIVKYILYVLILFSALSLSNSKNAEDENFKDFVNNFKAVAMHFSEPFLSKAIVKDLSMEAFKSEYIVPIVSNTMKETAERLKDDEMIEFAKALGLSYKVSRKALLLQLEDNKTFSKDAKQLEAEILEMETGNYRAIPMGWQGPKPHAVLMIIKKISDKEDYEMVLVNTGMGIQYHNAQSDKENNITPLLYRVWKKFTGIPKREFTDPNHWFIQALGLLEDDKKMVQASKDGAEADKYFYETILANFKKYEVTETNQGDDVSQGYVIRRQRSKSVFNSQ